MRIENIRKALYAGIVGLTILTGCAYKSPNLVSETKKDIAQAAEERVVSHESIEARLKDAEKFARGEELLAMAAYLNLARKEARGKGRDIEQRVGLRVREISCFGYGNAIEICIKRARENMKKDVYLADAYLWSAENYAITLRQISEKETNIREELDKK